MQVKVRVIIALLTPDTGRRKDFTVKMQEKVKIPQRWLMKM